VSELLATTSAVAASGSGAEIEYRLAVEMAREELGRKSRRMCNSLNGVAWYLVLGGRASATWTARRRPRQRGREASGYLAPVLATPFRWENVSTMILDTQAQILLTQGPRRRECAPSSAASRRLALGAWDFVARFLPGAPSAPYT